MKLTDATVRSLKPTDKRQEIPDDLLPGMYLVVQPTGKKSWQVRYRAGGKHRRMTLGRYPVMPLVHARKRAREVMQEAQAGADPAAEVKAAKREAPRDTVADALDGYAKRKLSQLKSGDHAKRMLERFVLPAWGDRQISSIEKIDVQDLIEEIWESGRGVTANRCLAYTKAFLNWCCDRGLLEVNPAERVKKAVKEKSRSRKFDDVEICWFWMACEQEGYPWGPLGQLLLLTGQRLNEIARLTESERSNLGIRLSAVRNKNGLPHEVPLSSLALEVMQAMPKVKNPQGYLFTTNARTPVQGFHKARQHLADRMLEIAAKERGEPVEIEHWTFHDLRRTCGSAVAAAAGTEAMEALLNHKSGKHSGVAGIYNRYEYAREITDALERHGDEIRSFLGNKQPEDDLKNMTETA